MAENADDSRKQPRMIRQLLNLQFQNPGRELAIFNPEERRARRNKSKTNQHESDDESLERSRERIDSRDLPRGSRSRSAQNTMYNDKGIHSESGIDLCDCLDTECPGCWRPCQKCKSLKCGVHCRVNRKFVYTKIYSQTSECDANQPFHLRRFPNLSAK